MPSYENIEFVEALEPGIREWFFMGANRRPSMIPQIFNIINSTKYQEHFSGFGTIGSDMWDTFRKSRQIPSARLDTGYKTTFTNQSYIVDLPIDADFLADYQYQQIIQQATQLGDSASLKREVDAASVFANAFDSNFIGADGVALCSDSHPSGPSNTANTQDNSFALSLSATNVETVRQAMMDFRDDKNQRVSVMPNLLIVPPELENTAKEIVESELQVDSAQNNINPQRGRFNYLVWHYLEDANAWFMADTMMSAMHLKWINRQPLDIYRKAQDETVDVTFVAKMRYSYGWTDWRWIAGSNPS